MDPLTHALSGAILARSVPKTAIPHRYVWLLAAVAMLPDIDYVLTFISDTTYLRYHRGMTHSFLMLPMWIWLLYSLLPHVKRQQPFIPWLIGSVLLAHIFLDLVTSFGTMILAPFSDTRASLDLLFIIDPLFTLLLILPLIFMLFLKKHARALAIISLVLITAYLSVVYYYHDKAIALTRQHHPDAASVHALPQPFTPFAWMLVASYPLKEVRTVIDFLPVFSGTTPLFPDSLVQQFIYHKDISNIKWQELPAMRSIANIDQLPGVGFYRWFARFPVLLKRDQHMIEFADLRFETMDMKRVAFRLRIELGDDLLEQKARAWLIWKKEKKIDVSEATAPPTSW